MTHLKNNSLNLKLIGNHEFYGNLWEFFSNYGNIMGFIGFMGPMGAMVGMFVILNSNIIWGVSQSSPTGLPRLLESPQTP